MSNRPVAKKKTQGVNFDDRFFETSISIMQNLSKYGDSGTGVNKIIEQTSSDRSYVIEVIKMLVKSGLLSKTKAKQGKVTPLRSTEFSLELTRLISQIDNYAHSLSKLHKSIKDNIDVYWKPKKFGFDQYGNWTVTGDYDKGKMMAYKNATTHDKEKMLADKLIDRHDFEVMQYKRVKISEGWTEEEIDRLRNEWSRCLDFIDEICYKDAFLALIYRFASIVNKFNPNKIAMKLLTRIVLAGLERFLIAFYAKRFEHIRDRDIDDKDFTRKNIQLYLDNELGEKLLDNIKSLYTKGYNISSFRIIYSDVRNFASSLLDLLYPPGGIVAWKKMEVEVDMKNFKENSKLPDGELALKDYNELEDLFESFLTKWNLRKGSPRDDNDGLSDNE